MFNKIHLQSIIRDGLQEDLGAGDLSSSIFPADHHSEGTFISKANGVLAGLDVIAATYQELDEDITVTLQKKDGDSIAPGEKVATASGPTAALLSGERLILNLLQHLSGIATYTKRALDALNDAQIRLCDTRKTLPGLRTLQKYAVRCGGGFNHRMRLDDGIMIKDNHIKAAGSITKAVELLRNQSGHMTPIEVETESRDQVLEAVEAGADIIMFDNRTPGEVEEFVQLVPEHIITEISGGITLESIGNYQGTGADYISMGSLTHSVNALDISFNLTSN